MENEHKVISSGKDFLWKATEKGKTWIFILVRPIRGEVLKKGRIPTIKVSYLIMCMIKTLMVLNKHGNFVQ